MDLRHFAEIILSSKAAARRIGKEFELDMRKVQMVGFSEEDCAQVLAIVAEIEDFKEQKLSSLEGVSNGLDRSGSTAGPSVAVAPQGKVWVPSMHHGAQ